ncbi:hypothetical protein RJ639_037573, partial [Escallonia herrerae]
VVSHRRDGKIRAVDGHLQTKSRAGVGDVAPGVHGSLLSTQGCHLLSQDEKAHGPNGAVFSLKRLHFLGKGLFFSLADPFTYHLPTATISFKDDLERCSCRGWRKGLIFIVKTVIIPTLQWILPDQCPLISYEEPCSLGGILPIFSFLRIGLEQFFYVFWFYPLYIFSFVLSNIWYNDIAKYVFFAIGKDVPSPTESSRQKELSTSQNTTNTDKPTDLGRVMIGIAEQVYSVLLLTFFFLEVRNLSALSLDKRLDFFESNWAFFAGFGLEKSKLWKMEEGEGVEWMSFPSYGSPCALAIFLFSPLVSYGVMAILFPLS